MAAVLSTLLSVTRGALLTAALIFLIRLLFHRLLSAKAKYYLWLLLALRLMLPVVPASPLSLLNFLPERAAAPQAPVSMAAPQVPETKHDTNPHFAAYAPADGDLPAAEVPAAPEVPDAPAAPKASEVPVSTVLFFVWLAGCVVILTFYGTLYIITAMELRRLPVCTDPDTLRIFLRLKRQSGIRGKLRLVSGGAGMLGGLLWPTIVLPVEQHGEALAPIIVHELMHCKYKDLWISALFRLLTAVYWFNPAVWLCFHWAKLDGEAACDQRVLETNLVRPDCYAGTLYEEGALTMKNKRTLRMQTTFGGNRRSLKRRIRLIATFKSPKVWATVLAVILAVGITACTMTGATSGTPEQSGSAEPQEDRPDFEAYMEGRQPPNGVFGLTLDEHVERGLLTLEDGTVEQGASEQAPLTFTNFCTVSELGGKTVDMVYHFSQTALSDAEILTQVFVTPPEDVPIGTWLSSISDPWLSGLTQNTDLNGWEWKADKYVADFLTEEQTDAAVRALVALGEISTSPDAMKSESAAQTALRSGWRVVTAFYTGEANLWQFNGTGAALIMAAQKDDAEEAPASSPEAASALGGTANTSTFSPYVLSGDSLTYENTAWDMTFSEVVSAQNLDMDTWRSSQVGQPTIYLDQPLSDHPEVARITYTFNVKNPAVLKTLSFVEVNYDPEKISYEDLVSQRTQEFGQPDGVGDNNTAWVIGNIQLAIYSGKNELRERILYYVDRSEELPPTPEQLEAFLVDIQPPNGHYGWTFEQHVEAGLLDPEQGEVVEGSTSELYYVFETEMELGGEAVTIDYVFSETMATHDTGRHVLTEVHVDPPDKIPFSQWVARFSEPWSNRMVRMPDANQWNSFLTVGPLLTDTQREHIVQELLENGRVAETLDEANQYLYNWNMAMNFYEAARGWVFNGTGAALYLTAQDME